MPCACNKKKLGQKQDDPIVVGRPNGAVAAEVRFLQSYGRINYGDLVWVTGAALQQWIDLRIVEPV